MRPIIALTDFQLQIPKISMEQESTIDQIAEAHALTKDAAADRLLPLLKRYAVKASQISKRYFENVELPTQGADILSRTQFFAGRAREVVAAFFESSAKAPDHLVHVTCTGYVSPSPVQHLVNDRSWENTAVTHAYHMGCYAALPAVRIAEGLIAANNKHVDIIHTEMCGLHMDRTDHSPEQMVVQSLFADGHIKYSAKNISDATHGFKLLAIKELIVPNSQSDMSWITASWGLKMTLSREVPTKIAGSLRTFVQHLCAQAELEFADVMKNAIFAVHPGGPKIIDAVKENLELAEEQIQASRQVLFERGNMSSATLPHVWHKLLHEQKVESGKKVLSLAFGPGLTIFGALFETI